MRHACREKIDATKYDDASRPFGDRLFLATLHPDTKVNHDESSLTFLLWHPRVNARFGALSGAHYYSFIAVF
jgi:hypothetical protein